MGQPNTPARNTLRDAAMQSKAWPFEEARKLVKRYPDGKPGGAPMLFETGYGPRACRTSAPSRRCCARRFVRRAYES